MQSMPNAVQIQIAGNGWLITPVTLSLPAVQPDTQLSLTVGSPDTAPKSTPDAAISIIREMLEQILKEQRPQKT